MKKLIALLLVALLLATLFVGCASSKSSKSSNDKEKTEEKSDNKTDDKKDDNKTDDNKTDDNGQAAVVEDTVPGTYVLKTINDMAPTDYFQAAFAEMGMDLAEFAALAGVSEDDINMEMTVVLKEDNTCTITLASFGEEETQNGTWTQSGKTITLVPDEEDSETLEATYTPGTLTISGDDEETGETVVYVLKKG